MKKYIVIDSKTGLYVERFFGNSVMVTENIERAGRYTKNILIKRINKFNLTNLIIKEYE